MEDYVIGVDIGGTTCKLGIFTEEGILLQKWEIPTNKKQGGSLILENLAESIQKKITELDINKERILGIGAGIPGAVTEDGVVRGAVNLGWKEVFAARQLEELTGFKVRAANDANTAALGEAWKGGAKGSQDVIMVTLGTGIGGGIISGGRILSGFHGAGGEIGHMTINKEETRCCSCGRSGCLEQYASATGIARLGRKRFGGKWNGGKNVSGENQRIRSSEELTTFPTTKDIFDAAKAGDGQALALVEEVCSILGEALAVIASVVDPEIIVLGGGVSKAGDLLLKTVEKYFRENAFFLCRDTGFALAKLGNDAGIYGGAKLALS